MFKKGLLISPGSQNKRIVDTATGLTPKSKKLKIDNNR